MLVGESLCWWLFNIMHRPSSAEGTGQKGGFKGYETFCSQLNLTQLRTWKCQILDLAPPGGQKFFRSKSFFSYFSYLFGVMMPKKYSKWYQIAYREGRKWFWRKSKKKIFWFGKLPFFWPSNPYLWVHYFLFLTFPKWSIWQVVVQLKSFNLSPRAALRAIEHED